MRRREKQITDVAELHEIIRAAEICRLALVDGDAPYVLPLSFGFDGRCLYFHSAPEGRKVGILARNNRVCVEFEAGVAITETGSPCNWSAHYRTVLCFGRAVRLTGEAEKRYALSQIIAHYDPAAASGDLAGSHLRHLAVYRIDIEALDGKAS
jgi:nitroimidazol reductase NimA-like FMN-containing flavoprotein (pyridoxamine 5'-phosphate oxidase superfamily)